jgi:hypothetical protein
MAHEALLVSEGFWYRGNASIPIFSDDEYLSRRQELVGHDVLVIGNRDINSAWPVLAGNSPVDTTRDSVRVGDVQYETQDKCSLFCRPFGTNSMAAFLGVTGPKSMRIAERMPFGSSGVAYPDYVVVSADAFAKGNGAICAAGYFDNDWSLVARK